jgi:hypothetical protein
MSTVDSWTAAIEVLDVAFLDLHDEQYAPAIRRGDSG